MIGVLLGNLSWNTDSGTARCPHKCLQRTKTVVSNETNGIEFHLETTCPLRSRRRALKQIVPGYQHLKNNYTLLWEM